MSTSASAMKWSNANTPACSATCSTARTPALQSSPQRNRGRRKHYLSSVCVEAAEGTHGSIQDHVQKISKRRQSPAERHSRPAPGDSAKNGGSAERDLQQCQFLDYRH